jgi:hypothetical protein
MTPQACHLRVLIARDAPVAVIFRSGPKKQTRLIRWDLKTDTFEPGQWFNGTIATDYADLSPSGQYLIYFATKHTGSPMGWTVISQPPYLTALAFWPVNHALPGGGIMDDDFNVQLNHRLSEMELGKGFRLRKDMAVTHRVRGDFWGTDLPAELLELNGWSVVMQAPLPRRGKSRLAPVHEKVSALGYRLWQHAGNYELRLPSGELWCLLRSAEWADWDPNGDLLFAMGGRLHRLAGSEMGSGAGTANASLIADFSAMRFEPIKAPPEARHWPYAR